MSLYDHYLNDDQLDHVRSLSQIPPEQRCWCGWFKLGECPTCDAGKTWKGGAQVKLWSRWRVGSKVPINVYEGDRPVCQCHNEEDAAAIVAAVNALQIAMELPDSPASQDSGGVVNQKCPTCGGSGKIRIVDDNAEHGMCRTCKGTGAERPQTDI